MQSEHGGSNLASRLKRVGERAGWRCKASVMAATLSVACWRACRLVARSGRRDTRRFRPIRGSRLSVVGLALVSVVAPDSFASVGGCCLWIGVNGHSGPTTRSCYVVNNGDLEQINFELT